MNPSLRKVDGGFPVEQASFAAFNRIHRQPCRDPVRLALFQIGKRGFPNRLHKLGMIRHVAFFHKSIRNIPQHFRIVDDAVVDLLNRPRLIFFFDFPFETFEFRIVLGENLPKLEISVLCRILIQGKFGNDRLDGQAHPGGKLQLFPMFGTPLAVGVGIDRQHIWSENRRAVLNLFQIGAFAAHRHEEGRDELDLRRSERQAARVEIVQGQVRTRINYDILRLIAVNPGQIEVASALFNDDHFGEIVKTLRQDRYKIHRFAGTGLTEAQGVLRRGAVEKSERHQIAVIPLKKDVSLSAFADK